MLQRFCRRLICCRRFTTDRQSKSLRESVREYGPLAAGVYMTISLSVFCCCFASITFYDIDVNKIHEWTYILKKGMGWDAEKPDHVDKTSMTWGAQVLLAMAMAKLFVPVKLGLTAAVTPFLARRLRYFGFNLSVKGGYKDATNQVKQKIKSFKDKNIP